MHDSEMIKRLMRGGQQCLNDGQYKDALLRFQRVLQKDAENAMAHFGLGRCLYGLEQFDDARVVFDYATKLSPKNPRFQRWFGFTLTMLERLPEAEAAFKRAADLESNRRVVVPFEGRSA